MGALMKLLATSVLSRWVVGALVALLLGGGALKWHYHKEGLREEGVQQCVQEINAATMTALEDALADERSANATLRASLVAAAAVNSEATARRVAAEEHATSLQKQMERQRNEDPKYREWSDTTLPDGVGDRLRKAAGSETDSPD